jgi:H+/Na+-translocating ferredoxin:NAD+ oxidoreductase subunit C
MPRGLRFRHGVHPPDLKSLTAALPVRRMPFPDEVVLPMRQHAGNPARPIVHPGDRVERGDKVGEADGFVSVPIHASATGTVAAVEPWPHQDGSFTTAVRIAVEPHSAQVPRERLLPRWETLDVAGIVATVREAGVVGLGGAAFPTHVKLQPPPDKHVETLVVNGCECEPYLTTDHRTMVDFPERVHLGIRIMMRCLGVERALVGVERNKPDAVAALERTKPADLDVRILPLTVKYPQGAEKMLIRSLLRREVPSGGLPMDVGVVVQNVASIATIAEVFQTGLPLIERIVTVTGQGVRSPANLIVPVGTKLRDLLAACGGLVDDAREIVSGGPMMGAAVASLDAPVLKGTTGIVVLRERECRSARSWPCIKCGHCLDACPVYLNPQVLGSLARADRLDEMQAHHLRDCMLCGCCSYVCPSNIPLSQMFAGARAALRQRKTPA